MVTHGADDYRKLLFELREAHAEYSGAVFGLNAYTLGEERALPSELVEQCLIEWTGGVWLPPVESGVEFRVWACTGPRVAPTELWEKVYLRAKNAWKAFEPLARRAGAHLPANVRNALPVEPATAESYWYGVLWWLQKPDKEYVWPKEAYGRFVSTNPILDSIEAIETCGLAGPEPRFPVEIDWEYDDSTGELVVVYSDPEPADGGGDGGNWQDVQGELDRLRLQGERYTSQQKLADKIGCTKSLVQKAISKGRAELQEWASKQRAVSRLNTTPEEAAVAFHSTPQRREDDPAEKLYECDVDVMLAKLLDQAPPEERARINEMSPAEKRQLAETMYRDPDSEEQDRRYAKLKKRSLRAD